MVTWTVADVDMCEEIRDQRNRQSTRLNANSALFNIGLLYSRAFLLEQHFDSRLPRLLFDGETGLGDRLGDPRK